ncbi:hypothetical protein GCM10023155_10690 [Bremerella cremea]
MMWGWGGYAQYYFWLAMVAGLLLLTFPWWKIREITKDSYFGRTRLVKLFQVRISTIVFLGVLIGAVVLWVIFFGINDWSELPGALVVAAVVVGAVFAVISLAWYFSQQLSAKNVGDAIQQRREGQENQFTLRHLLAGILVISLVLGYLRLVSTDVEMAKRLIAIVAVMVGLGLIAAIGYAIILGFDTLFFGRGSRARANRLRELEEQRSRKKSGND